MNIFQKIVIRKKIIQYLKLHEPREEAEPILDFLKRHRLTYFNYEWFIKYNYKKQYPIKKDINGRYYIKYNNKKMFFKKTWGRKQIAQYLNTLIPEQDIRSPHAYFINDKKEHYDVVIDAGAAEGLFTMEIMDQANKIYLIECDYEWIEALHKTFDPYKDKVIILQGYLSDSYTKESISLSNIIKDESEVDLIKMDIEGFELKVLKEAESSLSKIHEYLICVYHYQDELQDVTDFFAKNGTYSVNVRAGYIFFKHDKAQKYPYLRRGVAHITKL